MALRCKLSILTNTPYIKLLNKSVRNQSYDCGFPYPSCPEYDEYEEQNNMYQLRKYGHPLPGYQFVPTPFESLECLPNDVFRCTDGEELGPGAGKYRVYKNPEYFSFHHMSYYDMHLIMRIFRNSCIPTGRKPV